MCLSQLLAYTVSKVCTNQLCCGRGVGLGRAPTVVCGRLLGREDRREKMRGGLFAGVASAC